MMPFLCLYRKNTYLQGRQLIYVQCCPWISKILEGWNMEYDAVDSLCFFISTGKKKKNTWFADSWEDLENVYVWISN